MCLELFETDSIIRIIIDYMTQYAVVVNMHSRRSRNRHKKLQQALKQAGVAICYESYLEDPSQLEKTLLEALDSRPDVLIVGGGDGTIAAAAGLLANQHDVVLAIIPLGTANYFARNLKIPLSVDGAVKAVLANQTRGVPLGRINNTYFTFMANIGVSVRVAGTVSDTTKRYLGSAAYLGNMGRQIVGHKHFKTTVEFEGETHSFKTHELIIMNADLNQHLKVVPKTSLYDDKLLMVSYANDDHRLRPHVQNMLWYMITKGKNEDQMRKHVFSRAIISTDPIRDISIDGEVVGHTPATCVIVNDALRVIVNKG